MVNKHRVDWRYLGENMLVPAVTLVLMTVALGASQWFQWFHEDHYARYTVDQQNMHDNYDALIVRRRILESYHQRYDELQATGFIGREKRLDWVETIRSAAAALFSSGRRVRYPRFADRHDGNSGRVTSGMEFGLVGGHGDRRR